MADKVALIAGVTGIVGMNLAQRLLKEGWKVYGVSRRCPDYLPKNIHHLAIDLTNDSLCKERLQDVKDVKVIFFTSWVNKGTEAENCVVNRKIVENLIDNLPSKLRHMVLVTGTKQYMGPFELFGTDKFPEMETPFKERQPRLPFANFYYDQEDAMFERAKSRGFTWSVARPHTMIGFAPYNQMNMGTTIAVYASICKHTGRPFVFPGGQAGLNVFQDATDADLLAEHLIWEATNPAAANQAFNVVNGDIFRWKTLWKVMADYFGIGGQIKEPPAEPIDMGKEMADMGPVWDEIVKKHGLRKFKLTELVSWWHITVDAGRSVSCPTDMSKSRKMGFTRYEDTEESYKRLFDFLKKEKYIP